MKNMHRFVSYEQRLDKIFDFVRPVCSVADDVEVWHDNRVCYQALGIPLVLRPAYYATNFGHSKTKEGGWQTVTVHSLTDS